jgi:hypothetical protein
LVDVLGELGELARDERCFLLGRHLLILIL